MQTAKPSTIALWEGRRNDLQLSKESAWHEGTNVLTALRMEPQLTRAWLIAELAMTAKMVDAATTFRDDAELAEAVRMLLDEFPAMKLEEYAIVFDGIKRQKYGKLYNRLKIQEVIECIRKHEEERASTILERAHRPDYDPHERTSDRLARENKRWLSLTEEDLITLSGIKSKE